MTKKFQNKYRIPSARLENWDYASNAAYFITICTQGRACYFGNIDEQKMVLNNSGQIAENIWFHITKQFPYVALGDFVVMPNHVHGILMINKPDIVMSNGGSDDHTVLENDTILDYKTVVDDDIISGNNTVSVDDTVSGDDTVFDNKTVLDDHIVFGNKTVVDDDIISGDDTISVDDTVETRLIASLPSNAPSPTPSPTPTPTQPTAPSRASTNPSSINPSNELSKPPGGITGNKNPMIHQNVSRIIRWYKGRCTFEIRKTQPDFGWQSRFHDHIIRNETAFQKIAKYIIDNPKNWNADKFYELK